MAGLSPDSNEVQYVCNSKISMVTSDQIRAARALLDWSLADLSARSGIGQQAISKLENNETKPLARTLQKLQRILEESGVEFLPSGGIQPKQEIMRVLKGRSGFMQFIWDVHEVASTTGGEICVSNVKEDDFVYWLGTDDKEHLRKMNAIKDNFTFKIITEEGDTNFSGGSYAEYRWMPKAYFSAVPFYVYGNKFAIILFKEDVIVYVIEDKNIADAQRIQFDLAWQIAKKPVLDSKEYAKESRNL